MDTAGRLSAEERQRRLNEVSRQYMSGRMDIESFAAAERQYRPDYASAVRTLARQEKDTTRRHE